MTAIAPPPSSGSPRLDAAAGFETTDEPGVSLLRGAARRLRRPEDGAVVCLSTAHPAKFPDAVAKATGERPELPERLADLFDRPERYEVLGGDLEVVEAHVLGLVP